jgi:hypothetical protein
VGVWRMRARARMGLGRGEYARVSVEWGLVCSWFCSCCWICLFEGVWGLVISCDELICQWVLVMRSTYRGL